MTLLYFLFAANGSMTRAVETKIQDRMILEWSRVSRTTHVLFELAFCHTFAITIIYWALEFNPAEDDVDFENINLHVSHASHVHVGLLNPQPSPRDAAVPRALHGASGFADAVHAPTVLPHHTSPLTVCGHALALQVMMHVLLAIEILLNKMYVRFRHMFIVYAVALVCLLVNMTVSMVDGEGLYSVLTWNKEVEVVYVIGAFVLLYLGYLWAALLTRLREQHTAKYNAAEPSAPSAAAPAV